MKNPGSARLRLKSSPANRGAARQWQLRQRIEHRIKRELLRYRTAFHTQGDCQQK